MKFCALLSGGKDSCHAITRLCREGHELVCCANLSPESNTTTDDDEGSYCFQTAGHTALPVLCDCLGVPLVSRKWAGVSVIRTLEYQPTDGDEVEDLFSLLKDVLRRFPCVEAVSSGAILSNYQRLRVENVCGRLGLLSLAPLWRQPQRLLLKEMIESDMDAILIKVSSLGLDPSKHLGRSIHQLIPVFERLYTEYRFHMCGEGGEYETLSLDGPIFKKRLVLDETETVFLDEGAAALRVCHCHGEPKDEPLKDQKLGPPPEQTLQITTHTRVLTQMMSNVNFQLLQSSSKPPPAWSWANHHLRKTGVGYHQESSRTLFRNRCITRLKKSGGIVYTAGITALLNEIEEMQSYGDQVRACLLEADRCLSEAGTSLRDVCFVHLYLSDMSQFKYVNKIYEEIFVAAGGAPHSRCCVSGKPITCLNREGGGMKGVMLDCLAVPGSADAVLNGERHIRDVLHVRSRSHWAPLCIGPYCQANFVCHGGLSLVAGQIGLVPSTMLLARGGGSSTTQESMVPIGIDAELAQASANLAAVLQCNTHNGSSSFILSSTALCITVFVVVGDNSVPSAEWWMWVKQSVELLIRTNWNMEGEEVNGGGRQHENTEKDDIIERNNIPVQCVGVKALPGGAVCELEAIGTSKEVLSLLREGRVAVAADTLLYPPLFSPDGGTSCSMQENENNNLVSTCVMNSAHVKRCLCAGYVTLKTNQSSTTELLGPSHLAQGIANAIKDILVESGLPWSALLHVRLYFSSYRMSHCSSVDLIHALQDEFASLCNPDNQMCPTMTPPVITPICVSDLPPHEVVVAQLTCIDLDQLASRLWVHRPPV